MNIKDDNFFVVSGWMVNKLGLKGTTLNVFAIIYGFSQDGESEFTGSRQYLCDFTGATKPTVDKSLQDLCNMGVIVKTTNILNGVTFNKYRADLDAIKNFTTSKENLRGGKETLSGVVKKLDGGSQETLPNNKKEKEKENDKNNIDIMCVQILDYLNKKANTHFKPLETNLKFIKARLKDYSSEDLKAVIDKKVEEWKNDDTMCKYLRPETLFNATKFESYLNGLQGRKKSDRLEISNYSNEELVEMLCNLDEFDENLNYIGAKK